MLCSSISETKALWMTFYILLLFMKCWFIVKPFKEKEDIGKRSQITWNTRLCIPQLSDCREWENALYFPQAVNIITIQMEDDLNELNLNLIRIKRGSKTFKKWLSVMFLSWSVEWLIYLKRLTRSLHHTIVLFAFVCVCILRVTGVFYVVVLLPLDIHLILFIHRSCSIYVVFSICNALVNPKFHVCDNKVLTYILICDFRYKIR